MKAYTFFQNSKVPLRKYSIIKNNHYVHRRHTNWVICLIEFNGHLYSGSDDNTIIKWNKDVTINQTIKVHNDWVRCLTEFNGHLYSGSSDNTIVKWNKDGTINQTLKGHYPPVRILMKIALNQMTIRMMIHMKI